jgi:glycosyltransferase involved in cell wall biosynthesis
LNRHYCDFPFEDVEYLLVSSKCRPYKNYAGVIQAYEHVLRRFRRNLKLIVTGHLSGQPELVAELRRKGLVFDVIEATNVPDHVHSLLLANAQMLVIPTLFEGGMPFGFCEAIGMGTPCVMSRIPVVEETLTQEELATCEYFDPTDVSAMTRAILHVLDNREQVLARQSVIRERLLCRTWSDVAREYLALNEGDRVGPAG